MIRKLRRSPDTRARLPEAYTYHGSSGDADGWVRALIAETGSFVHPPAGLESTGPPRRSRGRDGDLGDAADAALSFDTGGADGSWLDGADEFALAIVAVIAVVVIAAIAVPLGLIAIELMLTFVLAAAGVILRLARVKPWTVLVLRDRVVVTVVAVKGWRSSRAVIAALRQHAA
ncbi:MAG: hypothetical protein ABIQ09_15280 [Jatrophihabitantaceae bacterium]